MNFKQLKLYILAVLLLAIYTTVLAQPKLDFSNPKAKLPTDPKVKIGTLSNGLKYYIRENKKPEKRMELRLAINAGAILEDDDQDGLAHFCEHMCFNGSKNFPKNDLIHYLQSIGMRFGADLNAYTSWDQTVYMLQVPTDDKELMRKGFLVLEDWSSRLLFEDEEVDKERGVITEEWRLGKGPEDRIQKKQLPVLFHNSKYAVRDVIGDTSVIKYFKYETLKRFYRDWYRPNLMAVVAIGDFDANEIEQMIKDGFGTLTNPTKEKKREEFIIPEHKEIFASVETDKELSMPSVEVIFKHKGKESGTYENYRHNMLSNMMSTMLNQRLAELQRKPNPPYLYAYAFETQYLSDLRVFGLVSAPKGENMLEGYETILTEIFRVNQHGFNPSELERAKKEMMKFMESAYAERDKTESAALAREYVANFTDDESMPGVEAELEIYKKYLPEIKIDEVNNLVKKLIREENVVLFVSAPEKAEFKVPTKDEVISLFKEYTKKQFEPYKDEVSDKPLFSKKLTSGKVVSEKKLSKIDAVEWTLSNGAKVVIKPTDFKNDEILFEAYSFGGSSLSKDEDYISANYSANLFNQSGISTFDQNQLEKMLAGKKVRVNSTIMSNEQRVSGSSTPDDLETFMQLINLKFTETRKDNDAYLSLMERFKSQIKSAENNPDEIFSDSVNYFISNYNFRSRPLTEKVLNEFDVEKAYKFYTERFAYPGEFTYFFVGNIDLEKFKPLVELYIASLPAAKQKQTFKDLKINPPGGKLVKEVKKGIEYKSTVYMFFHGNKPVTPDSKFNFKAMLSVLDMILTDSIREAESGTYGVGSYGYQTKYPKEENKTFIYFGTDPDRVEELTNSTLRIIKNLQNNVVDPSYFTKLVETLKRTREVQVKRNNFWLSNLSAAYYNSENPEVIVEYNNQIDKLTPEDIKKAFNDYYDFNNYIRFLLNPEVSKK